MHPELKAFFDVHRESTSAHKRAIHDQLGPIATVSADVQQHVIALEFALYQAELAPHDHALDGKLEWMHTRLRATRQRADAFQLAARELAKALADVETSFAQDALDVARFDGAAT